ncbi:VIT-domain-containing protein [Lentinula edodes]|uniref:VIT-domain-containing protein n=1 Tax=Lentinula edodes TaxID=5353 RepID=A0A1Q3EN77_LENED|nr:VIT-domain-containing protein [Lentinula edodes]
MCYLFRFRAANENQDSFPHSRRLFEMIRQDGTRVEGVVKEKEAAMKEYEQAIQHGSMKGERIRLVQEALVILLRGLPTSGTTFNIVSFGAKATKLWDVSRQYSQTSLEEATNHVDSMQADYGGTEIASALSLVYSSLPKPLARPVAVILLTDGSAWDVPTCVSHTQNAISALPIPQPDSNDPVSFIRVFTVGIGDGASSDTCDSIARAGNGFAVYVKQGEPVAGKCARVVRAARTPMVVDVVVDWTGDQGVDHGEQDGFEGVSNDDFEIVDNPGKGIQATTESLVPVSAVSLFNNDDDGDDKVMSEATGPPPAPDPQLPPPPKIQQISSNPEEYFSWYEDSGVRHCPHSSEREAGQKVRSFQ